PNDGRAGTCEPEGSAALFSPEKRPTPLASPTAELARAMHLPSTRGGVKAGPIMRLNLKSNSGSGGRIARIAFGLAAIGLIATAAPRASAQYRVGPVYPTNPSNEVRAAATPRSGYDPFLLDPRTGRFRYV